MTDVVNNPEHYNQGQVECIDAIKAMLSIEEFIGYLRGNSMKYRWRFRYKNGLEDLRKAEWYENRLLNALEESQEELKNYKYMNQYIPNGKIRKGWKK